MPAAVLAPGRLLSRDGICWGEGMGKKRGVIVHDVGGQLALGVELVVEGADWDAGCFQDVLF